MIRVVADLYILADKNRGVPVSHTPQHNHVRSLAEVFPKACNVRACLALQYKTLGTATGTPTVLSKGSQSAILHTL